VIEQRGGSKRPRSSRGRKSVLVEKKTPRSGEKSGRLTGRGGNELATKNLASNKGEEGKTH